MDTADSGERKLPRCSPRSATLSGLSTRVAPEKAQGQALDRTQPSLPMKPGRGGTITHDYKRHGTIDLFAAMNVGTGEVPTHVRKGMPGRTALSTLDGPTMSGLDGSTRGETG